MKRNKIYGLVLAGGLSSRMGVDKSGMIYHQLPQSEHMAVLLSKFCDKVFISIRNTTDKASSFPLLTDKFPSEGPIAGILTALAAHPDSAWLIAPVDMPALDEPALQFLLSHRSAVHKVTCFRNSAGLHPEPLLSIWEPGVYSTLLQYYNSGGRSVRDFLESCGVHLLNAPYPLVNINTPEERDEFLKKVQQKN